MKPCVAGYIRDSTASAPVLINRTRSVRSFWLFSLLSFTFYFIAVFGVAGILGDRCRSAFLKHRSCLSRITLTALLRTRIRKQRGGEVPLSFWDKVVGILQAAGIDPAGAFYTNALMGCKPGSGTGPMPTVDGYEDQCRKFLKRQIEIVQPLVAVALGNEAHDRLRKVWPDAKAIMHPSAGELNPLDTREKRICEQGERLAQIVSQARNRAI